MAKKAMETLSIINTSMLSPYYTAMSLNRNLDVMGLDIVPDEELPAYSPTDAPAYQARDPHMPVFVYRLTQLGHRTQQWVLHDTASTRTIYQVRGRPLLHVFSQEPDLVISKVSHSQEPLGSVKLNDDDGSLPWRPRARILHHDGTGVSRGYRMESRNLADWSMVLGDVAYEWRLGACPIRLVLSSAGGAVMAQFTWSCTGTLSRKGDIVGELVVYSGALSADDVGVEVVLCSVLVPIVHLKRMGRRCWNVPATSTANRC